MEKVLDQKFNFNIIRILRKTKNLTLKELARRAGMNYAILSRLERNQANITFQTLLKLSDALGMEPHDLVRMARKQNPEIRPVERPATGSDSRNFANFGDSKFVYVKQDEPTVISNPAIHGNELETMIVVRGKVTVNIEGQHYPVVKGEAIHFDATMPHTYECGSKSEMLFVFHEKQKKN
jgi:transcriptional regulator with XRE-family HTH domain